MTTEATPPQHELDQCQYNSTAEYLENLTRQIAGEVQTPDFRCSPLLLRHVHEDFTMVGHRLGDFPFSCASSRQALYENMDKNLAKDSALSFELQNVTSKVHRGSRSAEVYAMVHDKETRNGNMIGREGSCIVYWQRLDDGVWIVYRIHVLRGGGSYVGC